MKDIASQSRLRSHPGKAGLTRRSSDYWRSISASPTVRSGFSAALGVEIKLSGLEKSSGEVFQTLRARLKLQVYNHMMLGLIFLSRQGMTNWLNCGWLYYCSTSHNLRIECRTSSTLVQSTSPSLCLLKNFTCYKSSSVITLTPFLFSNAVVTPSPSISCRENVPSYICLQPHEGLLDFPINS